MIVSMIAAYAKDSLNRKVIGKDNQLPWNLPSDLRRFREYTTNNAIIMGRKTFESIGRVLPKRDNIILSRSSELSIPGAYVFQDLAAAIQFAGSRNHEVFVIGGQELYQLALPHVERLYLTEVKGNFEGDTFLPSIDFSEFKSMYKEESETERFQIYQRVPKTAGISTEALANPFGIPYYSAGMAGMGV